MFFHPFQPALVHCAAGYPVLQVGGAPAPAAQGAAYRAGRHDRIHLLDAGHHRREARIKSKYSNVEQPSQCAYPQ